MQCPNDNTVLQMTSREGIEIDYCPTCRGVWLDRGELDKLIERAGAATGFAPAAGAPAPMPVHSQPPQAQQHQDYRRYDDDDDHDGHRRYESHHDGHGYNNQHGHHKKKEGFLGDLFDF